MLRSFRAFSTRELTVKRLPQLLPQPQHPARKSPLPFSPVADKGKGKSVAPAVGAKKKSKRAREASPEKYIPEWDVIVNDTPFPDTMEGDRKNGREVVWGLASLPQVAGCFDDRPASSIEDILCNLLWKVCLVFLRVIFVFLSCTCVMTA